MIIEEYLKKYYGIKDESKRLETKHGMVEYITTMMYIEKYLKQGMRILEIGAGTGRYSHSLARMGYEVDAVELIDTNIEAFKREITDDELISIKKGNATDLSLFKDNFYDITLLLGPMYHLFSFEDKIKAMSEAIRVTRKGGIIYVAYCMSDATILCYGFRNGEILNLIKKDMVDIKTFTTFSKPEDIIELYRKEDIDILRKNFNVKQLHFVATDGYANHMKDVLSKMNDEIYDVYIKYHLATCERQDMVGLSHHTLDIFRKG